MGNLTKMLRVAAEKLIIEAEAKNDHRRASAGYELLDRLDRVIAADRAEENERMELIYDKHLADVRDCLDEEFN